MESALGGETVTEKVKKRVSKWDLVEDTKCPTETVQDNSKSADVADAHHDKDANSGCNWSKSVSSHVSKWSDWEANNTMRSEDSSGGSCCEPMPEHKGEGKDVIVDEDDEKISQTTRTRGASITSHIDLGRHHSHSRSGSPGWGRSCSRSRSPHGFKYEAESWNNRGRSGRGGSIAQCRDFAAGWCRRGDQCRFLHQDDRDYDGKGHCDRVPFENRGRRLEKGRFSRYASNEAFSDSQEQSGYSRDKDLHGYESHNVRDRGKHETQRNHRSSERCDDFLKGKCHRGSACKYVHHGAKVDGCGGWPSKDATRHRAHNRREDLTFEHDQRHEPHRSTMDTLCKYFAEGCCRNGEKCKFSHQGPTFGGPEENSQDGGRGNSSVSGNRPGGGLKWIDNSSGAGVGCPENVSRSHPKWGDKEADRNLSSSPFCSDTINIRADDPWNKSCEGPRWDDKPAETNFSVSPQRMSNGDGARRVPESRAADQFSNVTDMGSAGVNKDGYSHNMGRNETIHGSQDSYTWSPEADGQQLPVQKVGAVVFPSKDRQSQQKIPTPNVPNFNPSLQSQQLAHALLDGLNVNLNGQSRLMAPPLPSGQMDSNGQSQGMNVRSSSTDQAQMPICQGDSSEKHDLLDGNMSQLTNDVSIPQNAASTEKGAQLTDLSASLAQIFGNGQQLPQLYATLNHLSVTGLVPTQPPQSNPVRPSAPVAVPFIQPKQVPWLQSQNDPLTYSIEFVDPDINKQPARFPMNTHEQKNTSLEQLQAPQQILASSSGTDNQNEGELPENGSLEKPNHEKKDNQHGLKMDTEVVEVKEVATVQCEKDQQTGQLKEMDIDDQVNDEGKRSKDAKEMRMFKFALVEFVKELLKPTWKEGHMSKEAHKTIVKKVVDKVTGSLHGPHIPQTQERIDHYLSFSKPKLTKLVQAYVEKYLKT
ncbi:hypothetical protein AAC387_Pa04g2626 [Persea americana]